MKKLIILLTIALPSICNSQEEKVIVNVSIQKSIGNVHASDNVNLKVNGQSNYNAPLLGYIDLSIKTSSNVYIQPVIYASIINGTGTVDYSKSNIVIQKTESFTQMNNGKSTYESKLYGFGVSILKRPSKNLFVGGGFAMNYVNSVFINQFNTTYTDGSKSNELGVSEIKQFQYSIPINVKYLIPVGHKYVSTNFNLNFGKATFVSAGVGFSF